MLILLLTLLCCLLGVESQTTTYPVATQVQGFLQGQFKYYKPDHTTACALPYFVHITLFLVEGVSNATLASVLYLKIFGSVTPLYFQGNKSTAAGSTGIGDAYKKPSPGPFSPVPNRFLPDGGIRDSLGWFLADMVEFTYLGISSVIPLIAVSLQSWSPWQVTVPRWIRMMQFMIFDWANGAGGPLSSLPVAIASTPVCLFEGAVSADGKIFRLWFIWCVNSIFQGDFAISPGEALPTMVPGVFLLDMITLHIPYPWLAPNPCFPLAVVNMQVTFYKWTGLILIDAGNKWNNAYLQIGPIIIDVPFETTAVEMYLHALLAILVYPGSFDLGIAANTIQDTELQVITVMFVLGFQLQGGNRISIVISIGALAILNTPWSVSRGIILADTTTSTFTNAYIMIGHRGICTTYPGSVNCCYQSTALILVPFPSYFSYPAWYNSLVIILNPSGCVLLPGKLISFVIGKVYLGKNPVTTKSIGIDRTRFKGAVAQPFPVIGFWQIISLIATSAEPQGVLVLGFLESWPLGWIPIISGFELDGPQFPMSLWDIVMSGGLGCWVVGTATILSIRFTVNSNIAMVQPSNLEVVVTLRNGLAIIQDGFTAYYLVITTIPNIFRANVGSVTKPSPLTGSSPSSCAGALSYFISSLNTLFVGMSEKACLNVLGANAVIRFVLTAEALLVNGAAGTSIFAHVRLAPSMMPGQKWNGASPDSVGVLNPNFAGGIAMVNDKFVDTAALMWQLVYTIVLDCRNMGYQPSAVSDIATGTQAFRCTLVNAISYISPAAVGFATCTPGASTATAQNLITYAKFVEGMFTPTMWPAINDAQRAGWPQAVHLAGTIPIYIYSWGWMFSLPMFAVVVTYPATKTNLNSLGISPSIPTTWTLAFIVRMDRLTSACSVNTVEENPWIFCASITTNVVQLLHFPSYPANPAGVALNQYNPYYGWFKNSYGICAIVRNDGAVAGWYTTGISPNPDGGSDAAWYAFFAFFALPLLCLLCCLAWALWYFRKPKECCPCVPEYPVQEMYWVNAQPACPAPVYMVEPAVSAPVTCPPTTPIYLVQ